MISVHLFVVFTKRIYCCDYHYDMFEFQFAFDIMSYIISENDLRNEATKAKCSSKVQHLISCIAVEDQIRLLSSV